MNEVFHQLAVKVSKWAGSPWMFAGALAAITQARTSLVNLEDFSEEELEHLHEEFRRLHERARHQEESRSAARALSR